MRKRRVNVNRRVLLAGIGGVMAGSVLSGKAHAGVLNPPPPPIGPTGRSLADIEPRVPVSSLPAAPDAAHHITTGGHYKLTGSLSVTPGTFAIRVSTTDPVSIDLAGFTISGNGGGGGGGGGGAIVVNSSPPGTAYVEVCDGYIRDFDGDGIDGGTARVLECYDLHIENCNRGIVVRGSLVVEGCLIERCSSHGIEWDRVPAASSVAMVDDSECRGCLGSGLTVGGDWTLGASTLSITDFDAVGNQGDGLHLDIQNSSGPGQTGGQLSCRIQAVRAVLNSGVGLWLHALVAETVHFQCMDATCASSSTGMELSHASVDLIDCICSGNVGDGMSLLDCAGSVECCSSLHNGGDGLHVQGSTRLSISDCAAHSNMGAGVHLDAGVTNVAVQDSDASMNAVGFRCQDASNLLLRNTALSNGGLDYDLPAMSPNVVISMSQLSTVSNPHANYRS